MALPTNIPQRDAWLEAEERKFLYDSPTGNPILDKINAELYQLEKEKHASGIQTNRNKQRTYEDGSSKEGDPPF